MLKKSLFLVTIAAVLSFVIACGGTGGTVTPIEVIPEKSDLIAWLDLTGLSEDEDGITTLYEGIEDDPEEEEFIEDFVELIGGLEEGLMFMDLSETSEDDGYLGIIVKGTFIENDLVIEIEETLETDLEKTSYKNYQIYIDELEESGLCFLSADSFVFGTVDAIRDVIDVKEGSASAVSGRLISTYNALGEGQIKLAAIIPVDMAEEGFSDSDVQMMDPETMSDLETIGLTYNGNEEFLSMRAQLCFASRESAEEAEEAFDGLLLLLEMFSAGEEGEGSTSLVDMVNMEISGTCFNVDFEGTVAEIEAVLESMGESLDDSELEDFDGGFEFDFGDDVELDEDFWEQFELPDDLEEDFFDEFGEDFFNELEEELAE